MKRILNKIKKFLDKDTIDNNKLDDQNNIETHDIQSKLILHLSPKYLRKRCPRLDLGIDKFDIVDISDDEIAQHIIFNDYICKEKEFHGATDGRLVYIRFLSSKRNTYVEMNWQANCYIQFFNFYCYDSNTRYEIRYDKNFKNKDFYQFLIDCEKYIMTEYVERKRL